MRVSEVQGSAPPETTKVAINFPYGFRHATWLFPTGYDMEGKVAAIRALGRAGCEGIRDR